MTHFTHFLPGGFDRQSHIQKSPDTCTWISYGYGSQRGSFLWVILWAGGFHSRRFLDVLFALVAT